MPSFKDEENVFFSASCSGSCLNLSIKCPVSKKKEMWLLVHHNVTIALKGKEEAVSFPPLSL